MIQAKLITCRQTSLPPVPVGAGVRWEDPFWEPFEADIIAANANEVMMRWDDGEVDAVTGSGKRREVSSQTRQG